MICALAVMRDFSASMVLGVPVEPLVWTCMVGLVECQSVRNSLSVIYLE